MQSIRNIHIQNNCIGVGLHDNGYLDDKQFESLDKDLTRILKILTSIVKTMRTKLGYDKEKDK
jgi:hypothetical protein